MKRFAVSAAPLLAGFCTLIAVWSVSVGTTHADKTSDTKPADTDQLSERDERLLIQARAIFGQLPDTMRGSEDDTAAMIELGRKLYFENAMSVNKTQSCNDCHRLDGGRGGVDNLQTSEGALGKFGSRNAPTVLNAGFQVAQFWDGRADDLVEQAKGPPVNPIEMGMEDGEAVAERAQALPYADMFAGAFPNDSDPITFHNVARAISAFERTLISWGRFDNFVRGDVDALTSKEKEGLSLVLNRGCVRCHGGPLLGGVLYQKIGLCHPYENREDLGRFKHTGKESDKYVFKVPLLRNAALTAPYFHDGKVATLAEAVDLMGWLQLDEKWTNEEIAAILRFLTSLTDKDRSTEPAPDLKPANWQAPALSQLPEGDSDREKLIRYGHELLVNTYRHLGAGAEEAAMQYSGNSLDCGNCHQDAGTKPYGVPWVGVVDRYPTYRGRSDAVASLKDRINGCMQRSMEGRPLPEEGREMKAMIAYMQWLSRDAPEEMTATGTPNLPDIPRREANPTAGGKWYKVACQTCHGTDGSGYRALSAGENGSYVVPPLWGPESFNNGAGMHRLLKSAGFLKTNMPLGTPWDRPALSDAQAYDVAAYMNSQGRPRMDGLENDYPDLTKKPIDSPYPPYADGFPQQQHTYGPFQPIMAAKKRKRE